MALDFSKDYAVFDDPVDVVYVPKTGEGTWGTSRTIPNCQMSAVTKDDAARAPKLVLERSAVFHMWREQLNVYEIRPKAGDKFEVQGVAYWLPTEEGGTVWVVQSVTETDRDRTGPQRFRVVATRSTGAPRL